MRLSICVGLGSIVSFVFIKSRGQDSDMADAFRRMLSNDKMSQVQGYDEQFAKAGSTLSNRDSKDQEITDTYYNIATDFYEYGWGESFHFATRYRGESFKQSIARHEHLIAQKLNMKPGEKVLDMGCGVGGPMRELVRFTGADIVGITINMHQVKRCNDITKRKGLGHLGRCKQLDFTEQTEHKDGSFDKIYSIEALCHLNPRGPALKEAFRVLKPGGLFFAYDWVTRAGKGYNKSNPEHAKVTRGIEHGNGLPDIISDTDLKAQFEAEGFELLEFYDLVDEVDERFGNENSIPWYATLAGDSGFVLESFASTAIGRVMSHNLLVMLEALGLAPANSVATSAMLRDGADNLVIGGKKGWFTPMQVVVARKPM
jgi:sterol 24-C-methyltransferase